jgi:hypothetical protein
MFKKKTPYLRLFQIEYAKEYQAAVKAGVHVDERFAREFLEVNHRQQ